MEMIEAMEERTQRSLGYPIGSNGRRRAVSQLGLLKKKKKKISKHDDGRYVLIYIFLHFLLTKVKLTVF
jgi:hypothetical protein